MRKNNESLALLKQILLLIVVTPYQGNLLGQLPLLMYFLDGLIIELFFGKGADETLSAIISINKNLPYTLNSYNVDNGTEFLNRYFVEYFEGKDNVNLTRSRPYRKNDNCHAEQKNSTHNINPLGFIISKK